MIYVVIVFLLISVYINYNLYRKNVVLESLFLTMEVTLHKQVDYLLKLKNMVSISSIKLKEIDEKGSFSSDDEIGWFFNYVKGIQELLEEYITNNIKEDDRS